MNITKRVKLAIWLLTIKSQESTRFPCVQVAYDISLKRSRWGLQLCFKPHLNWRSTHKVMGPQSCDKMPFGCGPRGEAQSIRGKVVASPKFGLWWVLWVRVCPWLVLTPKVLQLCTNQLVIWFYVGPCEGLSVC
jgi:hypothetical protein